MELHYFVPFKAAEGVSAQYALREKLVNIEGVAVDTSVNANKWQVPQEDLECVASSLSGAQLRVDHAESALMVVGKVSEAKREGNRVLFRAEVGEERLIEKILRGYVTHVSIQVDSDDVECSKCKRPTRKEGMLVHLCPGAWEIIHKPRVRELSVVASPAYRDTSFQPVGFFAAMNRDQWDAIVKAVADSQLSENDNKDVGSKRERLQEPEDKLFAREVRHLSEHDSQTGASPHKAQGVVNVAPDETEPKQLTYEDFMQQLQTLEKQITQSSTSEADVEALKRKVAELEDAVAKRATKRSLSRKISELSKQLQQQGDGEEGGEEQETQQAARHASGKGIVAVDEVQRDALGSYDWFKDLLKAHKKLTGFR
jgi:hypothetical protein